MFKVEIIEPTRVILKDEESKAYVTFAFHETDEEGLKGIKSFQVGDELEIEIRAAYKPGTTEPEEEEEEESLTPPPSGQDPEKKE